jgi:hypothetical protein
LCGPPFGLPVQRETGRNGVANRGHSGLFINTQDDPGSFALHILFALVSLLKEVSMSAWIDFFRGFRYPVRVPKSFMGITPGFLFSGLCLFAGCCYVWLWSILAQAVSGTTEWGVGSLADILMSLRGGGITGALLLVGAAWLLLTECSARGSILKERDRRIADLEAKLSEFSR